MHVSKFTCIKEESQTKGRTTNANKFYLFKKQLYQPFLAKQFTLIKEKMKMTQTDELFKVQTSKISITTEK